ncbi:hypothetical protein BDC45DRAFT_586851 [Circinella umbellata]|nr:hypothetical protein BDC45DRAFT_586851 [Circinella umbellata]
MNQTREITKALPLEVVITIFMHLNITTFENFLFFYWIGPSWRRILLNYIFPKISYQLAQNTPFSNFTSNKHEAMRLEIARRVHIAQISNRPIAFSFPFLFMMYYVSNINIDYNSTKYFHADFLRCSSRTISNIILICGSNYLKTIRIQQQLPKDHLQGILRNLHQSKTIETVIIERAQSYDDLPNLSLFPTNRTLYNFRINHFQGTEEKRQRLYQFINNNFLAIRQIQIN